MIPEPVAIEGVAERVCMFGHLNLDFLPFVLNEDSTGIDPHTTVRLFVYVLLYRQASNMAATENRTVHTVVGQAVLTQFTEPGCISQSEGLNWQVQKGDRVGAFITSNCTGVNDLDASAVGGTGLELVLSSDIRMGATNLLCPSQINLVVDETQECSYAQYLDVSEIDVKEIYLEDSVLEQTMLNLELVIRGVLSAHYNRQVLTLVATCEQK